MCECCACLCLFVFVCRRNSVSKQCLASMKLIARSRVSQVTAGRAHRDHSTPGSPISTAVREADPLANGKTVRIKGVVKYPTLNGSTGSVRSHNSETRRYTIEVESGYFVALKAANLIPRGDDRQTSSFCYAEHDRW
jgi:hypothetical protein